MLDLQARVHLEEVELAADEQTFDRPRAGVADVAAEGDRVRRDPIRGIAVERGRGRLLHELLVPPLDRAVAKAELDDGAGASPRICTST